MTTQALADDPWECEHCVHPAAEHQCANDSGRCTGIYVDPVTDEVTFCTCTWDGRMNCGEGWACPDCRSGVAFWEKRVPA